MYDMTLNLTGGTAVFILGYLLGVHKEGVMAKDSIFKNSVRWFKLFTYICATVLVINNTSPDKLVYVIPLILLLVFVNYFRDYYLAARNKPVQYIWASIILEMLLILCTSIFNSSDANILFFFACISSVVISYPFLYSALMAAVYIGAEVFLYGMTSGFDVLEASIVSIIFSYTVSIAFVMVMSYVVKLQIREKERLARVNTELEQAYKRLIENSAAARKLTVEQERTRMAREIHDTLAHTLTSLIVQLEACKKLAQLDPSRLPEELDKAQELSREGFNDVKRSIKALRPKAMEDKTFTGSIISVINSIMENTDVHIALNNSLPDDIKLSFQVEVALFRVIQESITNSIRHGKANDIVINMNIEDNHVKLHIEDNGAGCNNIRKGYGLTGIRERIESLDGEADFSSTKGKGFKTNISIPWEAA